MGMSKKIDRHRLRDQNRIQTTLHNFFYVQDICSKIHFLPECVALLKFVL